MASGLTRNQVPGNRLRVRIPCPPLLVTTTNPAVLRGFLLRRPNGNETANQRGICQWRTPKVNCCEEHRVDCLLPDFVY